MVNQYAHRDLLKSALSIPATATGEHTMLDTVLEGVSRQFDRYAGMQFYPASGVRYYRPVQSTYQDLDYPLLNIDAIALDTDADSSYESTLGSTSYYTVPYNATEQSPPSPVWAIELRTRSNASAVFPTEVARGVRVTGTWGYYDERDETTAKPATAIDATATVWDMTGASNVHPGQTLRVDAEQVFVVRNALSGSATAATSGQITVKRAVNGTTGATHSSNSTMSIYDYPIIGQAALYQAEMDYRAKDAPLGISGGDMSGGQSLRAPGGLHPFVTRVLDSFRAKVAI